MLVIVAAWTTLLVINLTIPSKYLWPATTAQGFLISFYSTFWLFSQDFSLPHSLFFIDKLSGPLTALACWLFPLTMLASQSKIRLEPPSRQRAYITNSTFLQLVTLLAFTASDLMLFFIYFEASLIPTMILITRWGIQERRLEAGMYLAFYTLLGATPLLICLINFYSTQGSLSPSLISTLNITQTMLDYPSLFWFTFNMAFLMKLPMYCLHLWLPKAHVEAPVAGSMLLAGTLLKLGGYGILRTAPLIQVDTPNSSLFIMMIAIFGILATALLCFRQTDLKSLIAMSSVSHMNLVLVAALISSTWSFSGAMVMMIAHGLTSSALFCLANTYYERTNSRTMILLRGTMSIFPLASAWWLMTLLLNMGLPPSINFMGELLIMTSLYNWSPLAFLITALNLIFTATYTLYTLWATQRGPLPNHIKTLLPPQIREHLLLALHIFPGLLLILKPELITFYGHIY
uniref:NADH-ubiquinone oxidoreductase chain 4 n=1 Tax=Amolops larutensis TaxID=325560 RepID=D7UPU4_9NEOB|nr:NADH dehydrogenase subunit 4 [Amolops larutensis]